MRVLGRVIAPALWILAATVPAAAATPALIVAGPGHPAHMPPYAALGGVRVSDTTGASTAGSHATVAASSGRPVAHPEPTYVWHRIRVPEGACGAVVGGHPWVLPCTDKRVVIYRRLRARQRARSVDLLAGGVAAAVGLGAVGGWFVVRRRGHRTGAAGGAVTRNA